MNPEMEASRIALERQVEAFKHRQNVPKVEPVAIEMPGVTSASEAMDGIIATMERARARWAAFCESLRPQFDAAPETKSCDNHPAMRRSKLFEETCQRSRQDGGYQTVYAPCAECTSEASKKQQRAFWRRRGVPERVIDSTLSNFRAEMDEQVDALSSVREWVKRNGTFLLLRGTPGTGKGHLASGCLKAQGNGLWLTQADMLSDLRASYQLKTTNSLIDTWREAEMFVLDEFGLSPGGGDEEAMLYQVLADRYDKRRPTVITTNLAKEQFVIAIGPRLLDRIGEDCVVVTCAWLSHRTGK